MRRTAIIVTAAAAGVLAVAGVSTAAVASHSDDQRPAAATATAISQQRAVQIAQQRVPGSQLVEVELERTGVWEVDLVKSNVRYEVDVDATTGAIRKVETDHGHDDD